ncbi:MAG: hypothetical protein RLN72_16660 [Henriciella sp.]
MLHASTQKLIDRLAAMTAQNKIDWIEKDNGEVIYATEGYVVRLTAEPPRVLLTTEAGKPLEDATSTLLKSAPHADGGTYGDLVASITRQAYREARGTEDAINTLLAGLSDDAEIGTDAAEDEAPEGPEDLAVVAAEGADESFIEDEGDETEMLASGEFQSATEEEPVPAAPAFEAASEAGDTPEELVDESVPEAALIDADASFDTQDEYEPDAEPDNLIDEDDVGGAVARLADEVNGTSDASSHEAAADEQTAAETGDTAPMVEAEADEFDAVTDTYTETETETEPSGDELVSFSVMPDEGQTFDIEDDTSDTSIDTLAQSDLPAQAPEDATLEEVTEAAAELAGEPAETQWTSEAETTAETDTEVEAADFAEEIEDTLPAEDEAQAVAAASDEAAETQSAVRYVPFGAAGLAVAGADASEDTPAVEEDLASELGAASTMMTLPDEPEFSDEAPAEFATPEETETVSDAPTFVAAEADTPEDAIAVEPEEIEEDQSAPPAPSNVMSISGFSAGLGFGATSAGFTPSAPKTPDPASAHESVSRSPVLIDATDDYPEDFRDPVVDHSADETKTVGEAQDSFLSSAPVEAEATEEVTQADSSQSLETVDAGADSQPDASEEETESEPARPKTRFNPWT